MTDAPDMIESLRLPQLVSYLRRRRQNLALSQRALEAATGIKQTTISEIELGKRVPTLLTLKRYGDGVGVDVVVGVRRKGGAA